MAHAARHSRASSAGRCSGRQLERLVGHLTIGALLRREYLSIFSAVYLFSAKYRDEGAELWPAVRRELRWAASLLPPLRRDLAAKWATQVAASDASPRGRGATVATADEELVRSVGQRNERWRFARSSEEGAHARVHAALAGHRLKAQDKDAWRPGDVTDGADNFPEVPVDLLDRCWTTVSADRWVKSEHMPLLVARALLWSLKHQLRDSKNN